MSAYYPLWLDIEGRRCVVVGGGQVAERKVGSLLECRARVVVISPGINPAIEAWRSSSKIEVHERAFTSEDVTDAWLVFAVTGDRQVNQAVAEACQAKRIPVNVGDAPESGTFIVPAVLRRNSLGIAVSTEGKSPLMAQRLRDALEEALGPEYGDFVDWLGVQRQLVQTREADIQERRRAYEQALDDLAFDFKGLRADEYKEKIRACISYCRE